MAVRQAKTQMPSLVRVFAVCMKKAWVLSYPLRAQQDSDQTVGFFMLWLILTKHKPLQYIFDNLATYHSLFTDCCLVCPQHCLTDTPVLKPPQLWPPTPELTELFSLCKHRLIHLQFEKECLKFKIQEKIPKRISDWVNKLCAAVYQKAFEPRHDQQNECAPSLIRVFAVHLMGS